MSAKIFNLSIALVYSFFMNPHLMVNVKPMFQSVFYLFFVIMHNMITYKISKPHDFDHIVCTSFEQSQTCFVDLEALFYILSYHL